MEYAALCSITNDIASLQEGDKAELFLKKIREAFPPEHPLYEIDPSQIRFVNQNGMQAFVLDLDGNNAMVFCAGTNAAEAEDIFADVAIALHSHALPGAGSNIALNNQIGAANDLIHELENQGVSNIYASGHSLGGFIAASVTTSNAVVKECMIFDAPGQNVVDAAWNNLFNDAGRITSIVSYGSPVSGMTGVQIGAASGVSLDGGGWENGNNAGPVPYHSIDAIQNKLVGGASTTDAIRYGR